MKKDIKQIIKEINKKYGDNCIILGSELEKEAVYKIPTGSTSLDIALEGGIPSGRMITLSGMPSCGKSLLAYKIIGNAQRLCKSLQKSDARDRERECITDEGEPLSVALLQIEQGAYSTSWGNIHGVNNDNLIFVRPDSLEESLNVAVTLQQNGVDLIVIDSYATLEPSKSFETFFGDPQQMGIKPKALGRYHNLFQSCNNIAEREGRLPTTLIAINQLREKIGVLYGSPTYIPGGNSTLFTNSLEIRLKASESLLDESKNVIGRTIKWKLEKNKVGMPYQTGEFNLYLTDNPHVPKGGIDNAKELIVLAIEQGVIERRGSWFYLNGEQLGQGQNEAIKLLREDVGLFNSVKQEVMKICSD